MPALWESSERPMYVRTVWVNGFRHAILTKDDPYVLRQILAKKQRPNSSVSYSGPSNRDPSLLTLKKFNESRLSHTEDQLEQCFRKLHLVFNNERKSGLNQYQTVQEVPIIEQLDLQDIESVSEEELVLKASAQRLYEFESSRTKFNSLCIDMRPSKTAKPEQKEANQKYDLSERVFQWLDLAGKVDLLAPEMENDTMAQQRYSCPEIQNRIPHQIFKRKTGLESVKKKESPKIETPKENRGKIDRDVDKNIDSPPTPSDAIESYARQTRQLKDTSRGPHVPPKHATRPRAPPTHRYKTKDTKANKSDEVFSSRNLNAKNGSALKTEQFLSEMDANFETRQKVVSEIYDVERQYAELMGKNTMSEYNRQVKRQVHIFMPPVPKKPNASASTSRAESLLSVFSIPS